MNVRALVLAGALVLTAARVAWVLQSDPSPGEAFLVLCSERPAAAYFESPGGAEAMVGWARAVFGGGEGWRVLAPLWGLLSTLAVFRLARAIGTESAAGWTALGWNLLPIVNETSLRVGAVLPAVTLCVLAMCDIWAAYHAGRAAWIPVLAAAVCLAAAAWFAYFAVFVAVGLAVFLLSSARKRTTTAVVGAVGIVAAPLLALLPALQWNAANDWIPILPGTMRTLWTPDGSGFIEEILAASWAYSPLVLAAIAAAWIAAGTRVRRSVQARFVFLAALPGVVILLYQSLRGESSGGIFLTAIAPVAGWALARSEGIRLRPLAVTAAFVVAAACSFPATRAAALAGQGWRSAAWEVTALATAESDPQGVFLIASDPDIAAVLGHRLQKEFVPPPGHPPVYVLESQDVSNQFSLWPSYDDFIETEAPPDEYFAEQKAVNPFVGRSAIYIGPEPTAELPQALTAAFGRIEPLATLRIPGRADPLYIYLCVDYQTLPL